MIANKKSTEMNLLGTGKIRNLIFCEVLFEIEIQKLVIVVYGFVFPQKLPQKIRTFNFSFDFCHNHLVSKSQLSFLLPWNIRALPILFSASVIFTHLTVFLHLKVELGTQVDFYLLG